jgi:hypothetical protein
MVKRYHLIPLFCLLFFVIVNPLTDSFAPVAFAKSSNIQVSQNTCLQAPANLDPTTLTREQLRDYGFPDQYAHTAKGKLEWLYTIDRLKRDRHVCNASLSVKDPADLSIVLKLEYMNNYARKFQNSLLKILNLL